MLITITNQTIRLPRRNWINFCSHLDHFKELKTAKQTNDRSTVFSLSTSFSSSVFNSSNIKTIKSQQSQCNHGQAVEIYNHIILLIVKTVLKKPDKRLSRAAIRCTGKGNMKSWIHTSCRKFLSMPLPSCEEFYSVCTHIKALSCDVLRISLLGTYVIMTINWRPNITITPVLQESLRTVQSKCMLIQAE